MAPFLAALYGLVFLYKLVTLPAAVLARVAAVAPRWYLYMLETQLYQFVQNARWTLAISGWGTPSSADLSRPFAQLCVRLPPQRTGENAFAYPHEQPPRSHPAFWLADPSELGAGFEILGPGAGAVESSPYPQWATPDFFIDGPGYDDTLDKLLRGFAAPNGGPGQILQPGITRTLEQQTLWNGTGAQFGNAVDFSLRLLSGNFPAASFDLDADPGYGFLAWEGPPLTYDTDL